MQKITINGKERVYNQKSISFQQVVNLAYYSLPVHDRLKTPSITFFGADQAPESGILSPRTSVKIKEGTKFTCIVTGNA